MATQSFDKYIVRRLLGRGGMAEVYQAYDPDLDRHVAVKVIHPHLASDPDFGARFRREAKLVASLRHPHIVQLYDYDVADGQPFMVMEYLDGGTLKDHLAQVRGRGELMPLGEIARLLEPLADALDHAHAQGAVHRDIKPTNILFTVRGEPVLTDFGIAKILSDAVQLSASGSVVGTPAYMSPEQAASGPVDPRSDLYSLAVVLYEMATGRVPFQGDSPTAVMLQHLTDSPPPPRTLNPNLPAAVEAVILRALAKQPEQRFASAGELARAFEGALRGQGPVEAEALPAVPHADAATIIDGPPETSPPSPLTADSRPHAATAIGRPQADGGEGAEAPSGSPPPQSQAAALGQSVSRFVRPELWSAARDRLASALWQSRRLRAATRLALAGLLLGAGWLVGRTGLLPAPLPRVAAFLAMLCFAGSATAAVVELVRTRSQPVPRRVAAILALVALLGLITSAGGGLRPAAAPGGFTIAVGEFDGSQATRRVDFARRIFEQLQNELRDLGGVVRVVRTRETYPDAGTARARGARQRATLVIWGWYDDAGVSPHVEVLDLPPLRHESVDLPLFGGSASAAGTSALAGPRPPTVRDLSRFVRAPATMRDFDLFVKHGSQQITYISAALLGLAFSVEGDTKHALALFDKALANAPAGGGDVVGQELVYFQRAMVFYQQNRVKDAVADLQQAIAIKPDLFEAHYNLAIAEAETCGSRESVERAIAEAETAVRLRPGEANAHFLLGDLYRQAGRHDRAIAEFQAALQISPGDAAAFERLAAAYAAADQTAGAESARQQAVALREQAVAGQPADPLGAHLALGDAYLAAGEEDKALGEYQAAERLAPDSPRVHRALGQGYYWKGQRDRAETEYQAWVSAAPESAPGHLVLGLLYAETQKTEAAIAELEQATALAPCSVPAHLVLGGLSWQRGEYAAAAAEYRTVTTLDPRNADAFYLLGVTLFLQSGEGQTTALLDEAAQSLRAALALRPALTAARYVLGKVYFDQGAYDQAAVEWERVTQEVPSDPTAYISLADAYEKLERLDEAIAAYQKALALQNDADTHVYLALIYHRQGRLEQAIAEYQQALVLDPRSVLAASGLAEVYAREGKLDEAAAAYRQALAANESAALHAQLAAVYARQGELSAAADEYRKGVSLDPQAVAIRLPLARLFSQMGRLDEAEAQYRAVLATDSKNAAAHYGLGLVEYKRCHLSTMEQEIEAAAGLAPEEALYRAALATVAEARGQSAAAAQAYAGLQAAPASDAVAHLLAGDFLLRTGQLDAAAGEFQRVLDAAGPEPVHVSLAHSGLGQVYAGQGRTIPAASEFRLALSAFPTNAEAQAWLGDLALRGGEGGGALAAYDRAITLLPEHAQQVSADDAAGLAVSLQARRGLTLSRQGNHDGAATAFDQAVALAQAMVSQTPQWPRAHFALAQAYAARGDSAQAAAEFAAAAQCDRSLVAEQARAEANLEKLR
ncbi:MAG: tetratricopeptide repeat protein [Ardenticatenaceae bacterium]|nr:tetratricopeptide repeat protein [Ardenticatenaceae bacterium]